MNSAKRERPAIEVVDLEKEEEAAKAVKRPRIEGNGNGNSVENDRASSSPSEPGFYDIPEGESHPSHRQVYVFMIHTGIRLKLKNRSVCTAILLMHKLFAKELTRQVCNYTLATACILIGLKFDEENGYKIRRVCHVAQSILASDAPALTEGSEEVGELATGVGRLEFVAMREVGFQINFDHPHSHLALMLQTMRAYMAEEFEKYPIARVAASLLRDCYVVPTLVLEYTPKVFAVAIISLAFKAFDVAVPMARSDWYEMFSASLSDRRLRHIERDILLVVYGQKTE